MASYYVYYNNVDLTNVVRVRTVDTTVLPPRENNSITIWERPGSIYNAYRFGEREIRVAFLVRAMGTEYKDNPNIMEEKLDLLRTVFKVEKPMPLYLGTTSKYIYAVPEGDFNLTELRYDCFECEITFICHDPEYYGTNAKVYSTTNNSRAITNNKTLSVYNGGDASTYPIVNVSINKPSSFVQVENVTTGQKLLLGNYPTISSGSNNFADSEVVSIDDSMNSLSSWSTAGTVDEGRDKSGSFKLTQDKSGITINNMGSGFQRWKGASGKRTLSSPLTDFCVKATMKFNNSCVNGDPTVLMYDEVSEPTSAANRTYYYKVAAPSVSVKSELSGNAIDTLEKGTVLTPISQDINEGYAKVSYSGRTGLCDVSYLKKYISDKGANAYLKNMIVSDDTELRTLPSNNTRESKLLATIPAGTVVRVWQRPENEYYKLYIAYNDKIGYIHEDYLESTNNLAIEYPEDEILVSSENKTGLCEVYGYSASGAKLFKLSLTDDNIYHDFVKPSISIGDKVLLEDINSAPKPNLVFSSTEANIAHDYLEEGVSSGWNNFYGELGIQRVGGKWQGWIYKMENGVAVNRLMLQEKKVADAPTEDLSYVVVYIGANDENNMSGMSISHLTVSSVNQVDETSDIRIFKKGDELKLDCYNNKVYLNNKLFNNINISSQFIELVRGDNIIKVSSDDSSIIATVLFNERYL